MTILMPQSPGRREREGDVCHRVQKRDDTRSDNFVTTLNGNQGIPVPARNVRLRMYAGWYFVYKQNRITAALTFIVAKLHANFYKDVCSLSGHPLV